ncbi:unnamed protein product, partial [Ectocarpus sp. 12 AP-2014]
AGTHFPIQGHPAPQPRQRGRPARGAARRRACHPCRTDIASPVRALRRWRGGSISVRGRRRRRQARSGEGILGESGGGVLAGGRHVLFSLQPPPQDLGDRRLPTAWVVRTGSDDLRRAGRQADTDGHLVVPDAGAEPLPRAFRRSAGAVQGHRRRASELQERHGRARGDRV